MKKIFGTFLILLLLSSPGITQQGTGSVSGTVVEYTNGQPVANADVKLYRVTDSAFVKGTVTDSAGSFTLRELPFGRYYLQANLVGYRFTSVSGIAITGGNRNVALDPVKLSQSETRTDEIVVEGEKTPVEFMPDKKVFNVSKSISAQGGTLLDLLKEIPSVTVDQDGNVSLRGNQNVKITVDSRPFGLEGSNRNVMLEQIPANSVDRIELITNPSAKYEAEGSSGIINIILKKNERTGMGYNGILGLNAGTGDKFSGNFNLTLKNNKINLYGSYNYNMFKFIPSGSSERISYSGDSSNYLNQTTSGSNRHSGHLVKSGIDLSFSPLSTMGFMFNMMFPGRSRNDVTTTKEYDINGNLMSDFLTGIAETDEGYDLSLNGNYALRFSSPGRLLTADVSYSRENEKEESINEYEYSVPVNTDPSTNKVSRNEINDDFSAQADYVHPFSKESKLELGYKGTYKKRDNDNRTELLDYNSGSYYIDTNQTNRFIYYEHDEALYSIYTNKAGNFGYSLGLRGELTLTSSELMNTSVQYSSNYIDIFPSVSLSYKLWKSGEIQASYSRRLNRPRPRQLNPFITYRGANNYFAGNPELKPEYTDSYELGFIQYLPVLTVTPSVFYKRTRDEISQTRNLLDSISILTTFVNYSKSESYGGELIFNSQPYKFLSLNGNLSYYITSVDASNISPELSNEGSSWTARINSAVLMPYGLSLQAAYFYSGKRFTAQGYIEPFQSLDASLKKDLFEKRFSITLRVTDILNTLKFRGHFEDRDFTETFERKRNSRTLFLNISYNFGEQEKNKSDRRKRKTEDNQDNNDEIDF